jgi:hypothetical protein
MGNSHVLTKSRIGLPWKDDNACLGSQEISSFYGTRKFITIFTKARSSTISWQSWVSTTYSYNVVFNTSINLIFLEVLWLQFCRHFCCHQCVLRVRIMWPSNNTMSSTLQFSSHGAVLLDNLLRLLPLISLFKRIPRFLNSHVCNF